MFYLNEAQQQLLLIQPETGLGYQLVELTTMAKRRVVGVAYNAELVLEIDEPKQDLIFPLFVRGIPVQTSGVPARSVRMLARDSRVFRSLMVDEARAPYAGEDIAATRAPVATTKVGENFTRFSVCAHDRRIRADGSLRAGSYATTAQDGGGRRPGKELVARYALPHPAPVGFAFMIQPVPMTLIQYGTVQPAHAQPGGGVEVLFTEGTTPCTVSGPEPLVSHR